MKTTKKKPQAGSANGTRTQLIVWLENDDWAALRELSIKTGRPKAVIVRKWIKSQLIRIETRVK